METNRKTADSNITSQDEIRQKVDGFSLENVNVYNSEEYYITTDQGVYYPPDDKLNETNKSNK